MMFCTFIAMLIKFIQSGDARYQDLIDNYVIGKLPSGYVRLAKIDLISSNSQRIVITSGYHVMNELGFYAKWINFRIIVTPVFGGIDLKIRGNFGKYQELKDYLIEMFYDILTEKIDNTKIITDWLKELEIQPMVNKNDTTI